MGAITQVLRVICRLGCLNIIQGFTPIVLLLTGRPLELVFYCEFTDINVAIEKEKQIKKWSRAKKEALINDDFDELVNLAKKNFGKE